MAGEDLSPFTIAVVRAACERGAEDIRFDVALFEAVHDGVIVCETDRRVIAVNPAFETMSGWSNDAVQGVEPRLLLGGKATAARCGVCWMKKADAGNRTRGCAAVTATTARCA